MCGFEKQSRMSELSTPNHSCQFENWQTALGQYSIGTNRMVEANPVAIAMTQCLQPFMRA